MVFTLSANILENQASEYLRLNGFFLIPNFVVHFENARAQEIDLIDIRPPGSVEMTMYSDGSYSNFVFKDDAEKLDLNKEFSARAFVFPSKQTMYFSHNLSARARVIPHLTKINGFARF